MHSLKLITAAALLFTPSLGLAQDGSARVRPKQLGGLIYNFRSFDCALVTGKPPFLSGSGTGSFGASGDGGIEVAVSTGPNGAPSVLAHAINTKGMGANDRGIDTSCPSHVADGADPPKGASCDLSGDASAPTVRFTLPLSAFGDGSTAKNYVGHVTLIKQRTVSSLIHMWLSKKGYDYYRAQSDLSSTHANANPLYTPVATCSTNALADKTAPKGGSPMIATYDLAVQKK